MHPGTLSSEPEVYLRDSQRKIIYPELFDPAHLTIDVLGPPTSPTPARLSYETIIKLAENGVPPDVFFGLLQLGVDKSLMVCSAGLRTPFPLTPHPMNL
jgi:hypothetical protein